MPGGEVFLQNHFIFLLNYDCLPIKRAQLWDKGRCLVRWLQLSIPSLAPWERGCILWHHSSNCQMWPKHEFGAVMHLKPCPSAHLWQVKDNQIPTIFWGWQGFVWHFQSCKSSVPPAGIICPHVIKELILTIWLITAIITNTMSNEGKSMVK